MQISLLLTAKQAVAGQDFARPDQNRREGGRREHMDETHVGQRCTRLLAATLALLLLLLLLAHLILLSSYSSACTAVSSSCAFVF